MAPAAPRRPTPRGPDEEGVLPAPRDRRGLRTGYTTGACAAAATRAAARWLASGVRPRTVAIPLPAGSVVEFPVSFAERAGAVAVCGVIKDAGDDPDVTHGAEVRSQVRWRADGAIRLHAGEGVGTVTLQGLGLEVGGPAINPVPRQMIAAAVEAERPEPGRGADVTISIPGGAALATRTLNGRLGIVGGLSILGTTGIVRPYSTASWRASVLQAVDVAAAGAVAHVILSTGGRSERFARALLPQEPQLAFVEMGEFTGHALRRCAHHGITQVTLAGMVGKFSKIAAGHLMTHVAGNQVDPGFLAELAAESGAAPELVAAIAAANTARHAQELVQAARLPGWFDRLAGRVVAQAARVVGPGTAVTAFCFDFDGRLLGRAPR